MRSLAAESGDGRGDVSCPDGKPEVKYGLTCAIVLKQPDATCDMVFDMFEFSCCDDCAESTGDAAPIEVAQFAAAEEAVTRAEAATSRVIDSGLVLVRAGSPGVLRFDHFQALQAGMAAPLTCNASHPGNGIGTKYPEERMFGEWRYTESKMVAAQNACMAQLVQGKFIKRVDANLVLDVAFWVFQEGTAVNWVGGGSDSRTYLNGGGRDFRVNPDGSISLVNHPHLALGVFDPETKPSRTLRNLEGTTSL